MRTLTFGILFTALAVLLGTTGNASAQSWGDIKGQVIWAGPKIPDNPVLKVGGQDGPVCTAKGPLLGDDLIIDKKTLGVKNVMVWLRPIQGKMPIHPTLKAVPKEKVIIDQPCCQFIPRITMMREGQILVVKNPSTILHNSKIDGDPQANGTHNPSIPAKAEYTFEKEKLLKAERKPMLLSCSVHGWMGGRIGVFDHPYFAVTKADGTFEIKNAPAGKFAILIQHEVPGWLHKMNRPKLSDGEEIMIPAGGTLDMGKIKMQ